MLRPGANYRTVSDNRVVYGRCLVQTHDPIAVFRFSKRGLTRVLVFPNQGDSIKPTFDKPIINDIECPMRITDFVF